MNPSETTELLSVFEEANFPSAPEVKKSTIHVWSIALDDVRLEDALIVAHWWVKNERWFPRPADIRHHALDVQACVISEELAWSLVQPSSYKHKRPPELVLAALRDVGGAFAVAQSTDPSKMHEQFIKAYRARRQELRDHVAATNLENQGFRLSKAADNSLTEGRKAIEP